MKKFVIFLCLLIAGAAAWRGLSGRGKPATGGEALTAKVSRQTIDVTVEAVGEINPALQVIVKPEVGGRIAKIQVHTGQAIDKGDPLLSLDDAELLTEKDAALTEIAGAQMQLDKATRDFDRLKNLFGSQLVSQEIFDNARTTLDLARNDYARGQKQLQAVEEKLKKIRIDAPFKGTVLSIAVSEGQVVSGAAGVNQGTDLMTFADLSRMVIRAHINQVDVTKLQVGQKVEVTVDSIPDTKLEGQVTMIAPVATVQNNIKGFGVDVLLIKNDGRVRPGMNANLRFPVLHVAETLSVPLAAVFVHGSDKVVYVRQNNNVERRVVVIGASDYRHAQILSGLEEGIVVLLEQPKDA